MSQQYRIVFRGELADGFEPAEVRLNLGRLCKYDEHTLDKVFSGRPMVLRSGLDQTTAERYRQALAQAGALCSVEALTAVAPQTARPASAPAAAPPAAEPQSMICPKCGTSQPRDVFCVNCGIAVEKYHRLQNASPASPEIEMRADAEAMSVPDSTGSGWQWLLLSPRGRLNRKPFWLSSLALGVVSSLAAFFLAEKHLFVYIAVACLLTYASLMIYIKRAHDRDRSGHFCWLLLIPIVSLWPVIELGFFKGTAGVNRFGADPLGQAGGAA